ncbi:MAG: DUF305 domain-containing protein [Deltaproteobacteria bacterium]|nr:DUF305 domain-containing protein [Deltaproteobacteria bacterium]
MSHGSHTTKDHGNIHYLHLLMMSVLSFFSMYALMYAMVDSFSNVYFNLNQFYMAGLMTAPMILIEILVMKSTYQNKKLNSFVIAGGIVALIGFFTLIREQTAISDKQFLKSMIPHHGGAILMCQKASIENPEIKDLCQAIISSQQQEINEMKAKLAELEK